MSNWYDQSQVIINGSGIMADTLTVSSKSSVEGLRALGRKGAFQQAPTGPLQTSVSVDYYLEPANEPNYSMVQGWKEDITSINFPPIRIEVCGITGSGWIDRYSVKSTINTPAKASASYIIYGQMSGVNSINVTGVFDLSKTSGLAHGWTTALLPINNSDTSLYSDFDYSCSLDWRPSFALGKKEPFQMQLGEVVETISITRNISKPILFSGQRASDYYDGVTGVELNTLDSLWTTASNRIQFGISGVPVVEGDMNLPVNGYITVKSRINKYY